MRRVSDSKLRPWSPPEYRVDTQGKVEGARPGEPHNWGRWGEDDQRGTLNLLTPERVAAAAGLVRTGKRFALGLPIGGPPTPGYRPAPLHFFERTVGDGVLGDRGPTYSDDFVVMALQATTQLDGLAHMADADVMYNGYWAGLVTAQSGARRLGVHHHAEGVAGRGVVLDVARHLGVDHLDGGTAIGPDLLDATGAAQGVDVGAGDILLVRTGHLGRWFGAQDRSGFGQAEPGLSGRCLGWLHDRDVAMVATDTLAVEVLPPEPGAPLVHIGALRDLGLLLGELFDLDELAADCAEDGVYECFLVAAPLPVVNGVGSPLNPIAFK